MGANPSEQVCMSGPLGGGAKFRLCVTGDFGPREIRNLIQILSVQAMVLRDEDDQSETTLPAWLFADGAAAAMAQDKQEGSKP